MGPAPLLSRRQTRANDSAQWLPDWSVRGFKLFPGGHAAERVRQVQPLFGRAYRARCCGLPSKAATRAARLVRGQPRRLRHPSTPRQASPLPLLCRSCRLLRRCFLVRHLLVLRFSRGPSCTNRLEHRSRFCQASSLWRLTAPPALAGPTAGQGGEHSLLRRSFPANVT